MKRILITGATGQIGTELTMALRAIYPPEQVVASGRRHMPPPEVSDSGPFFFVDVLDRERLSELVAEQAIDTIFHLAALLSAKAEARPLLAWQVNISGLRNVLEVARRHGCALFFPSSIAVFGPSTPREATPQETVQRPTTIYGISKLAGELLCDYYFHRYGVDCRGVRYPGLISAKTRPGGGTTDYAAEIFAHAVRHGSYECYLRADSRLEMMFMADAIAAALGLMAAPAPDLRCRNGYNLSAMNFTPAELAAAIQKQLPAFRMGYKVDPLRQAIADSWPATIDDSVARAEWGWRPRYDLTAMVAEMLTDE
ncbi:MAG: NAD-dependent epimerase/dehydratase family protein [Thermodesulfobacteriota bacterium]